MKEVLTKSFWQGVKNTFYEAMESEPAKEDISKVPAGGHATPSSPPENSSSTAPQSEETSKQ
jgi:hypothetical protein